jgi:hypothetical protein
MSLMLPFSSRMLTWQAVRALLLAIKNASFAVRSLLLAWHTIDKIC